MLVSRRRFARRRACAGLTPPSPSVPLGRSMLRAHLRPTAALLLSLRVLPAANQLQALRVLAIPLIPAPGLVDASAVFAQTNAQRQPTRAGGSRQVGGTLGLSHGRACSRRGRPGGSRKPLGHLLFGPPRRQPSRLRFTTRRRPADDPFPHTTKSRRNGRLQGEGDGEGHSREFLVSGKETLPKGNGSTPKETKRDGRKPKETGQGNPNRCPPTPCYCAPSASCSHLPRCDRQRTAVWTRREHWPGDQAGNP